MKLWSLEDKRRRKYHHHKKKRWQQKEKAVERMQWQKQRLHLFVSVSFYSVSQKKRGKKQENRLGLHEREILHFFSSRAKRMTCLGMRDRGDEQRNTTVKRTMKDRKGMRKRMRDQRRRHWDEESGMKRFVSCGFPSFSSSQSLFPWNLCIHFLSRMKSGCRQRKTRHRTFIEYFPVIIRLHVLLWNLFCSLFHGSKFGGNRQRRWEKHKHQETHEER